MKGRISVVVVVAVQIALQMTWQRLVTLSMITLKDKKETYCRLSPFLFPLRTNCGCVPEPEHSTQRANERQRKAILRANTPFYCKSYRQRDADVCARVCVCASSAEEACEKGSFFSFRFPAIEFSYLLKGRKSKEDSRVSLFLEWTFSLRQHHRVFNMHVRELLSCRENRFRFIHHACQTRSGTDHCRQLFWFDKVNIALI